MGSSQDIFGVSSDIYRLEKLGDVQDGKGESIREKKYICLSLLLLSLLANGLELLLDLEDNLLELVSVIHKVPFCKCYLPSSMVVVLISVKMYLSLDRAYPGLLHVVDLKRVTLQQYLSFWTSAKQKGILTSEEKITFDGNSESWPVFCIEMRGILIKYDIQDLLS